MTIDPLTGQVSWTPGGSHAGDADVVVQAADPDGGIASQAFIVRVRAANSDPVINTVPPASRHLRRVLQRADAGHRRRWMIRRPGACSTARPA
jgi:urease accessory protein UreH